MWLKRPGLWKKSLVHRVGQWGWRPTRKNCCLGHERQVCWTLCVVAKPVHLAVFLYSVGVQDRVGRDWSNRQRPVPVPCCELNSLPALACSHRPSGHCCYTTLCICNILMSCTPAQLPVVHSVWSSLKRQPIIYPAKQKRSIRPVVRLADMMIPMSLMFSSTDATPGPKGWFHTPAPLKTCWVSKTL